MLEYVEKDQLPISLGGTVSQIQNIQHILHNHHNQVPTYMNIFTLDILTYSKTFYQNKTYMDSCLPETAYIRDNIFEKADCFRCF